MLAEAHDLLVRAENADPGDGGPPAGRPGARGPVDHEPASHRGRHTGDNGLGLPRGQAFAAPGVVVVMDADHIPRLKQPGQDFLCGHEAPGQGSGQSAYTWTTPRNHPPTT